MMMARGKLAADDLQNDLEQESRYPLLVQSHFGSFQFLHAMAPDGQTAEQTLARILGWAELTYKLGASLDKFDSQTRLNETGIPSLVELANSLTRPGHEHKYQLGYMFDASRAEQRMRDVAFGSLLHMIQDSFAPCHTQRKAEDPRKIVAFYSYLQQSGNHHSKTDLTQQWDASRLTNKVNPIYIGHQLVLFKHNKTPWDNAEVPVEDRKTPDVKTYLSEYFQLEDPKALTKPGADFCMPKHSDL
ncbi:MAG: hypothetical protein HQL87_15080 [Magnetococcales bacterium]|nr:hypothetical protein [Magnetococcales bacterium]